MAKVEQTASARTSGRAAHFAKCALSVHSLLSRQPRQLFPKSIGALGHSVNAQPTGDETARFQFPQMTPQGATRDAGRGLGLRQGFGLVLKSAEDRDPSRMGECCRYLEDALDRPSFALEGRPKRSDQFSRGTTAPGEPGPIGDPPAGTANRQQTPRLQRTQICTGQRDPSGWIQARGHGGDRLAGSLKQSSEDSQTRPVGERTTCAPERRLKWPCAAHVTHFAKCGIARQGPARQSFLSPERRVQ